MVAVTSSGTAVLTLPTDTQILVTREFDAPRHLVYQAWTTPELIKRWWSGDRGEVTSVDVDLRVGGTWRYVMVADGGPRGRLPRRVPRDRSERARRARPRSTKGVPEADGDVVCTYTFTEHGGPHDPHAPR